MPVFIISFTQVKIIFSEQNVPSVMYTIQLMEMCLFICLFGVMHLQLYAREQHHPRGGPAALLHRKPPGTLVFCVEAPITLRMLLSDPAHC